ncbi:HK97 gp10 family phage protein [Clostridium botulinum]|nr:HK97 gp10 family phage protein [Clostridium botulinum]NFJ88501.1 HK97 gp10 family phage protein [Clostridium botulinum]HDI3121684.1 HK97 gp10 family phage protein [Clostridium botulinum]
MSNNQEQFMRSIEDATLEMILNVTKNMKKACLSIEKDAKKYCPVDDSELRTSITSDVESNLEEITGRTGSNKEYAPYVHNGTGIYAKDGYGRTTPWVYKDKHGKFHKTLGQRPQPFLEQARDDNMDKITQILAGD